MTEQEQPKEPKPKRQRKVQEAIVVAPEPDVRLGSLAISNPAELVKQAADLATVLAGIINQQKLFSIIKNKRGQVNKYVKCEGWTTMGAMLGVVPVEDYCRPLPNGNGFEAKINLIRGKDGGMVGSASAECTRDESNWKNNDSYSLRSMALTRATSKAFRLSFSWIIKLAGFEATPAEEMMGEEDASVERQAVETEVERQKKGNAFPEAPKSQPTLFWVAPDKFNGHRAQFLNLREYGSALTPEAQEGLKLVLKTYLKGDETNGLWVPTSGPLSMDGLLKELAEAGVQVKRLESAS